MPDEGVAPSTAAPVGQIPSRETAEFLLGVQPVPHPVLL